jgi:hypothetical protein
MGNLLEKGATLEAVSLSFDFRGMPRQCPMHHVQNFGFTPRELGWGRKKKVAFEPPVDGGPRIVRTAIAVFLVLSVVNALGVLCGEIQAIDVRRR